MNIFSENTVVHLEVIAEQCGMRLGNKAFTIHWMLWSITFLMSILSGVIIFLFFYIIVDKMK